LNGATVIPGIVSSGTHLGLIEIEQEEVANDGKASKISPTDASELISAADGIEYGTKHVEAAKKAGVTASITSPVFGQGIVSGVSTAFRTFARSGLDDTAIIKDAVALHVQLGQAGRNEKTPSNSAQIAFLRSVLKKALYKNPENDTYAAVARGNMPFAVHCNSRDLIAASVRLVQEIRYNQEKGRIEGPGMKLVIVGGAEAHLIADDLADENVSVILGPAKCIPIEWETRRCLPGPPLAHHTGLDILYKAGVNVGITSKDSSWTRNLIWDAGWNVARGQVKPKDAIAMVTWNIAKAFNVDIGKIKLNSSADFVVYDGDFSSLDSRVMLVAGGTRRGVVCYPTQA